MGCVTSGQKQHQKKHNKLNDHGKNSKYNDQSKSKNEFRSLTYTSIEDALDKRNAEIRKSEKHLKQSDQIEILSKYRMSAEDNKCAIPKITACEYGPILIHNPGSLQSGEKEDPIMKQLVYERKLEEYRNLTLKGQFPSETQEFLKIKSDSNFETSEPLIYGVYIF